jgi:putative ABC transport system permease protein
MLVVVCAGATLGAALAAALAQVLRSRLYAVTPGEPWSYMVAILVLPGVVLAASLFPAVRASRTPPADVLRAE